MSVYSRRKTKRRESQLLKAQWLLFTIVEIAEHVMTMHGHMSHVKYGVAVQCIVHVETNARPSRGVGVDTLSEVVEARQTLTADAHAPTPIDAGMTTDAGWDVAAADNVGRDIGGETGSNTTDAVSSLTSACTSSKVKAGGLCQGYWPGTNPPVLCSSSCRDYAEWSSGTSTETITMSNPLLGCYAWDMTSPTSGRAVVCLSGESFCDIYCPVVAR